MTEEIWSSVSSLWNSMVFERREEIISSSRSGRGVEIFVLIIEIERGVKNRRLIGSDVGDLVRIPALINRFVVLLGVYMCDVDMVRIRLFSSRFRDV